MAKKTVLPGTVRKPASGAKTAARNAARNAAALTGKPAAKVDTPETGEDLKLRDLVSAVADASDLKRSEVKEVTEEALRRIGQALGSGQGLNLPGLGKVKIKRVKTVEDRRVVELRLRQDISPQTAKKAATDGVAEDDD